MDEDEFDKFADEYQRTLEQSLPCSGDDVGFFAEYKVKETASLASRLTGVSALRIMDFGAGVGASVPYFLNFSPAVSSLASMCPNAAWRLASHVLVSTPPFVTLTEKSSTSRTTLLIWFSRRVCFITYHLIDTFTS